MVHPEYKTDTLEVEGFHCADCAVTIENTVVKVNGVHKVKANFVSGRVQISYDSTKLEYPDLVNSVEKIGYKVSQTAHKTIESHSIWRNHKFILTVISGIGLSAGLAFKFLTADPVIFTSLNRNFPTSTLCLLAAIMTGAFYFSRNGFRAARDLRFNMDFLMALAVIGAIIIQEYVEAASLAFLFSLAELMESYAIEKSRRSLRGLMQFTPEKATIKQNGEEQTIAVKNIKVGDTVIVRPGERLPVDGKVASGASSVNQAPITGESVPVNKSAGDEVYSGSINVEGYLEIETMETSENSMVARIIQLIEEGQSQKAPSEKFVLKFAKIYTPVVVATAFAVAIIPPLFFQGNFNEWFIKALTLLVIACPCALVISTPVSVVSALTSASRNGVLIKGGVFLEALSKIKIIAFDKTGTLTTGRLKVTDIISQNGMSEEHLLRLAVSLETKSEHPIGKAIVERSSKATPWEITDFVSIPGQGVTGKLNGRTYLLGKPELFSDLDVSLPSERLTILQQAGKTTMLIGTDSGIEGIIALSDEIRPNAAAVINELKEQGIQSVMITGDNTETARTIATQLGIQDYHAASLPQDKLNEIEHLKMQHGQIAMVGDGINDAPAIAAATVGIAMGAAGTHAALETADIALVSDDLTRLPYLFSLSKRAHNIIKQNISASIIIKLVLALGVFPGFVSLVVAVLVGDMGASLGVTANAMRLAKTKAPR